jgi:hypothetical protein
MLNLTAMDDCSWMMRIVIGEERQLVIPGMVVGREAQIIGITIITMLLGMLLGRELPLAPIMNRRDELSISRVYGLC